MAKTNKNSQVVYQKKGYTARYGKTGYDIVRSNGVVMENIPDRLDAMDRISELAGDKDKILGRMQVPKNGTKYEHS